MTSLRMTKREREREQRETEGDAHVRRERDRVREELARGADLEDVRAATLVVSDADIIAVALSYDASELDAVPRVVAIARDEALHDLLREAREHGVPSVEDGDLAARLAIVTIGAVIPEELYEPVARRMPASPT
jgi:type III secretory pathway component EscU